MIIRNRRRRGFTLVEVLLVIAIIGVLAGVFVFTIGGRPDKAKSDAAQFQVQDIVSKLEEYKLAIGEYPTDAEGGLKALIEKPTFDDESKGSKWAGPYIKKQQLKDPWGQDLGYEMVAREDRDSAGSTVHVWSYGKNKQNDSGEGDDIKSWQDPNAND